MSDVTDDSEVQKALEEFHQYLSDQVPPLIVADSIALLLKHPAELVASSIHSWIASLKRPDPSVPISDYLYHGVMKINLMREYKLIPSEELVPFLTRLKQAILEYCPPQDRELLRTNLDRIEEAPAVLPSNVEVLFRQTTSQGPVAGGQPSAREEDIWRFGLMIRRLERQLAAMGATVGTVPSTRQEELVSDVLVETARTAGETVELNELLDDLRRVGISAGTDDVFHALGRNLPGWSFPNRPDLVIPEDSNLQAMRRIIARAPNPQEAANRFGQLVKAAMERFNEGYLAQAVSMIELAEKIIAEKEVEGGVVETVKNRGDENLDPERLRKFAESPDQHSLLRKILNFFVRLSPQGLMESLRGETVRERRRLLLLFLECHGEQTRSAALQHLQTPPAHDVSWEEIYLRRNLIYLLRRIPPSAGESLDDIVEIVLPHAELKIPLLLVKEAITYLAQLKHDKVELAFVKLLTQIESMLMNPKEAPYEALELLPLLDRVVVGLCRCGTPSARRVVIAHSLKKKTELGDTMARLTELSGQDLSGDQETVDRLLAALKSNFPLKLFGMVFQQREHSATCIVEALSGTPLPRVRRVLEELAQQRRNDSIGRAAAKALDTLGHAAGGKPTLGPPSVSLMGDLDLFGLPALLQSFADSAVTGTLTLRNPSGEVFAILTLVKGKLRTCEYGALTGEEAFYQLFERPNPGTFQFIRTLEDSEASEIELKEILALMFEGMRRYDEVKQSRAILPDDVRLKSKAPKPRPLVEEKNGLLFRDLWAAVQRGATPQECETTIGFDSFRIRRLLDYWVETGVIEAT